MWTNTAVLQKFCNNLLPELQTMSWPKSEMLSLLVNSLYDKYFKAQVSQKRNEEEEQRHIRQLLSIRSNQTADIVPTSDDIWIFGYGSLVWKADFAYIDRRRGYINGYARRFYQNSIDHRGTPTKPGRVVTLLQTHNSNDRVYGIAYRISAIQKDEVLQHLDYREKNGYERRQLQFQVYPEDNGCNFDIIIYIATQDNDSYAGDDWQISSIAEQIVTSAGPSGRNRDYLFYLATAMRELFPDVSDRHLYELEREVMELIETTEVATVENVLKREIVNILKRSDLASEEQSLQSAISLFNSLLERCTEIGWKEAILSNQVNKSLKQTDYL